MLHVFASFYENLFPKPTENLYVYLSVFQCRELYFCVKESMEKAAARNNGKLPGIDVSLHQTIILVFKNNCDHALFIYMHQNVQ